MNKNTELTTKQAKELIRHPYAWPGGYEVIFYAIDGEILCHKCARDNWVSICDSMVHDIRDGWQLVGYGAIGADVDHPSDDNPIICAHCNRDFSTDYK
jgi:hypothetical protein